ncbi:MAG: hypothetical protein H6735_11925 [Alphaproteobacteria bacterium]|nr:hypothetical protein [Alphaproteobacteria bacterium]
MLVAVLAGCGPTAPEAWLGVDQAVVLPGGRIVADITATRQDADLTRTRKTDRCFLSPSGETSGCVLPPPGSSSMMLVGGLLLDERTADGLRAVAVLDPGTLEAVARFDLGLPTEGKVAGGALWARDGGVVLLTNHGLAGVVADDGEQTVYAIESWHPDRIQPRWRRALPRWPDEVLWTEDAVLVHANGVWSALDAATGVVRWRAEGVAGGCVGAGQLWLAQPDHVVSIDLTTGKATGRLEQATPGWVAACVWREGAPLFHGGGLGGGDGWLMGPGVEVLRVPRVDLELGAHVDAGELWIQELGRGLVVVDPAARRVGPTLEVHDVVRLGERLGWYTISADARLRMTLTTADGALQRERQISPRPWHVDGQVLYTFSNIAARPQDLVASWQLPGLSAR